MVPAVFVILLPGDQGWGDELLLGAATTLLLACAAFPIGVGLGAVFALARSGPDGWRLDQRWVRWIALLAGAVTACVRALPEAATFILAGIVLHSCAAAVGSWSGLAFAVPALVIGAAALVVITAAQASEILYGGICVASNSQLQVARALGLSRAAALRRVVLPLALRAVAPGLRTLWLCTIKNTALVALLAGFDLMRAAQVAIADTMAPFVIFLAAGGLYLAISAATLRVLDHAIACWLFPETRCLPALHADAAAQPARAQPARAQSARAQSARVWPVRAGFTARHWMGPRAQGLAAPGAALARLPNEATLYAGPR